MTASHVAHPLSRSHRSLSGPWHFIVDPYDRGEGIRFFESRSGLHPHQLVEYDFETSDTLQVPGDWNTQRPELFLYEGVLWLQRRFEATPREGRRAVLHFGAASYRAKVWLNGEEVGTHEGGFTPFALDVTAALVEGDNALVAKIDALHGEHDIPTRITDWKHYGGLTRDVLLLDLPETFVSNAFVQLSPEDPTRIVGWVQLDGPQKRQRVEVAIPELGIASQVETDSAGRARLDFEATPERWSPDHPRLYDVEVRAETDTLRERIGFRHLEARGGEILLNGEAIFLRGISIHEEALGGGGRAHGDADARALLGVALELGANFVRLAHYPHDESMARAADELGVLVWEEIPLYWGIAWDREETAALAQRQITELIERDHNHASVALWSLSNETHPGPERGLFLSNLAACVRSLDPTRLVTSALFGNLGNVLRGLRDYIEARIAGEAATPPCFVLDDDLADVLDVVGWNQYVGWYYSAILARSTGHDEGRIREIVLDGMAGFGVEVPSGKPLVVSEFGAGAKFGRRGDPLELWSEDYQARVYREQLAMIENAKTLRGLSPWILKDFRTPLRFLPGIQDGWNRKGLISELGEKKLAFEVLRAAYERHRASGRLREV